jgi:hypothetical protein
MKPRNVASARQHSLTHSLCYVSHTLKYLPFKRSAVIGRAIIFIRACPKNHRRLHFSCILRRLQSTFRCRFSNGSSFFHSLDNN